MSSLTKGWAHSPTVLVVDDTSTVRMVVRRSLEFAGYRVEEARDGQEALSFLAAGPPVDLVIADLRMPKMDGCALARELKKRWPATPILFISGYDAHQAGADLPGPVLAKPFTPEVLITSVGELLPAPQPRSA
jgi:CheY-like chemotaxis protein